MRRASGTGRAHRLSVRSTPEIHYGSNGFRSDTCFEVPLRLHCSLAASLRQTAAIGFSPILRRWGSGIETAFRLHCGEPRGRSVYKVDHCSVAAIQEPSELPEIWRGHVVVHRV